MSSATVFFSDVLRFLDDFLGMTAPSKSFSEDKLMIDSLPPRIGISSTTGACTVGEVVTAGENVGGAEKISVRLGFNPDNSWSISGDVCGPRTARDGSPDRRLDPQCLGFESERMPQQQRHAEQRAAGVGDTSTGDVRR